MGTCGDCLYSTGFGYSNTGYCRRYPPTCSVNSKYAENPYVRKTGWCGEYKYKVITNPSPQDIEI